MEIKDIDPWYALFWVGMSITLIWLILKSVGVIQTPVWIQMLPFISAVLGIMGIVKYILKYLVIIKVTDLRLGRVEERLTSVENRLTTVERKLP